MFSPRGDLLYFYSARPFHRDEDGLIENIWAVELDEGDSAAPFKLDWSDKDISCGAYKPSVPYESCLVFSNIVDDASALARVMVDIGLNGNAQAILENGDIRNKAKTISEQDTRR
jgi:hypothetical protein